MRRREFIGLLGAAAAGGVLRGAPDAAVVETVRGPVPAADLGVTLPHEHVLVDFVGAAEVSPDRYDVGAVVAAARPHLERARALGVRTLFECTPAFLARDPLLLRRLSQETGLHLVTNTGLYGARSNRFLPPYAFTEDAAQLAARWVAEFRDGIDGTGIRPGFIKCGVDSTAELSEVHGKLVEAAARTHRETGLAVAVHTGRGPGRAQLEILARHGVSPEAFVWVHAQAALDDELWAAADRGAWLSFDGLGPASLARHQHLCTEARRRGHWGRVLLSHDAGWFDPAQTGGGTYRGYDLLFTAFLPALREAGFTAAELDQVLMANPARAFALRGHRAT